VRIKIVLHSSLRTLLADDAKGRATLDLPEGSQISNVIDMFHIPDGVICAVNDQLEPSRERFLANEDMLRFLRPSVGG